MRVISGNVIAFFLLGLFFGPISASIVHASQCQHQDANQFAGWQINESRRSQCRAAFNSEQVRIDAMRADAQSISRQAADELRSNTLGSDRYWQLDRQRQQIMKRVFSERGMAYRRLNNCLANARDEVTRRTRVTKSCKSSPILSKADANVVVELKRRYDKVSAFAKAFTSQKASVDYALNGSIDTLIRRDNPISAELTQEALKRAINFNLDAISQFRRAMQQWDNEDIYRRSLYYKKNLDLRIQSIHSTLRRAPGDFWKLQKSIDTGAFNLSGFWVDRSYQARIEQAREQKDLQREAAARKRKAEQDAKRRAQREARKREQRARKKEERRRTSWRPRYNYNYVPYVSPRFGSRGVRTDGTSTYGLNMRRDRSPRTPSLRYLPSTNRAMRGIN